MFPIDNAASSSRTIFINPNFNKLPPTHINPKFLRAQLNPSIHVNPNFLAKNSIQNQSELQPRIVTPAPTFLPPKHQLLQANATVSRVAPLLPNKIISKSRTKIIRVPMKPTTVSPIATTTKKTIPSHSPGLVKIGLRKLIRPTTTVSSKPNKLVHTPSTVPQAKYKIDRRILTDNNPIRKRKTSFTGHYAFRRSSESISRKVISRFMKRNTNVLSFSKIPFKTNSIVSKNRQLLNINGVLYKSTRNKLERKDVAKVVPPLNIPIPKKVTGERAIFVRGTKYLLDKSGFNLTRVSTTKPSLQTKSLRRIDIGGLTYVANSKNVLVRTDTHLTRNHVSNAKQKSIHLLSRRFVKTNMPCPIFQRVGKCASFERGKCMNVHDKLHVAICPRFLRGECLNKSCLLSHNVSLSKMPVCKFFLQGCCVREDCPYLHKKLSAKAEVCIDFLKGFCKLAQKCDKRHEFVCPDMESKGKCEKVKCPYCKKQQMSLINNNNSKKAKRIVTAYGGEIQGQVEQYSIAAPSRPIVDSEEPSVGGRYFAASKESIELGEKAIVSELSKSVGDDESDDDIDDDKNEDVISAGSVPKRKRPQLGDLPAFIPFS